MRISSTASRLPFEAEDALLLLAQRVRTVRRARGLTQPDLAAKAGISKSYASEILSGKKAKTIGLPLAAHIFSVTGWRHDTVAHLTDEQIETLAQIAPWQPR